MGARDSIEEWIRAEIDRRNNLNLAPIPLNEFRYLLRLKRDNKPFPPNVRQEIERRFALDLPSMSEQEIQELEGVRRQWEPHPKDVATVGLVLVFFGWCYFFADYQSKNPPQTALGGFLLAVLTLVAFLIVTAACVLVVYGSYRLFTWYLSRPSLPSASGPSGMHPLINSHRRWRFLYGTPIVLFLFFSLLPYRFYGYQPLRSFSGYERDDLQSIFQRAEDASTHETTNRLFDSDLGKRVLKEDNAKTESAQLFSRLVQEIPLQAAADGEQAVEDVLVAFKWRFIIAALATYGIGVALWFGWYALDRLYFKKRKDPFGIRG